MVKYYKIAAVIFRIFALFAVINGVLSLIYFMQGFYSSNPNEQSAPYMAILSIVFGIVLYAVSKPISKLLTKDLEDKNDDPTN